ncbi:MAG TPA: hypothetical protein GXZ93_06135 [Actinobacteria bacterium]|jgi:hypothetical protein|nr:hypothetical protein [Actinomycetota bacterium]
MGLHPEITSEQKKKINRLSTIKNNICCYIDKKPVSGKKDIEYHNIDPISSNNSDIKNFTVVCKNHHRELGDLSISEYLAKKEMEDFFKNCASRKLNDVLALKTGKEESVKKIKVIISDKSDTLELFPDGDKKSVVYNLMECPSTGFKYFYASVPVGYINNDENLQPRPLEIGRLWDLYRHLLVNSQLTPSVCRMTDESILLFDGQHKAAAQVWAGRTELDCKIYVEPDVKSLKETNLIAHDKLRQMPFFTSVLINKWANIFEEEWKEYLGQKGFKSEEGFVSFLVKKGRKRAQAVNMIESNIYDSIMEDKKNLMVRYIADYNRNIKSPLTINRLKQAVFKKFIAPPPLDIDIEDSDRLREAERRNIIKFLNIIAGYSLDDIWNPENNDDDHKVSERIYLAGAFRAWTGILKDVISAILEIFDENEKKEIFLREISKKSWEEIENSINFLFNRRVWQDGSEENYSTLRLTNDSQVRKYLSVRGISVNAVLGKTGMFEDNFVD